MHNPGNADSAECGFGEDAIQVTESCCISLQTAAGEKKNINFAGEKVFEFPSSCPSEFYSICQWYRTIRDRTDNYKAEVCLGRLPGS